MFSLIYSILTIMILPINNTVADSSEVVFILQTPVSYDTVFYDCEGFIRFVDITVSDIVGYPEVPMITCFVAVPDGVDPELEWCVTGEVEYSDFPVYPAPEHVISYENTQRIVEEFRQDSAAYASCDWWPSERVRIVGETRICDQRLIQIQIFPVLFRACNNSQSAVSAVSVALTFDSTQAEWSSIGLGPFQNMVEGSPIVGYHYIEPSSVPIPLYFKNFDLEEGPLRTPDYIILAASGLYEQCGDAIDDLAEHRVNLNGFDVALVTTDKVLNKFGVGATELTPDIIRNFTEYMWENWGDESKKPSYLLLIGDHEDISFSNEPWFLPTHEYKSSRDTASTDPNWIGNDEWFVYFDHSRDVNNAFPDMMVGRLSVKNSPLNDTLSTMIDNIIDMEQPVQGTQPEDHRRRIVRLAGTGKEDDEHVQHYENWAPEIEWTRSFAAWLGYEAASHYCGDGRWFTDTDGSKLKSRDFRDLCLEEFSNGAGVIFYSDHGDFHMFSAGLEWDTLYCPFAGKGALDSTFNCINARLLEESEFYSAPFVLMLCCGAGTFNHTAALHPFGNFHPEFCLDEDPMVAPPYDFTTDCLAEAVHKNTGCPTAGVFCGALSSWTGCYDIYGCGILEAIYAYGHGRIGDSVADSRFRDLGYFATTSPTFPFKNELGQFNLLGDPALDITDRVRYPDKCDLVVYPGEMLISEYPRETTGGFAEKMCFTVRNNGGAISGSFDLKVMITDGLNKTIESIPCSSLLPGEELVRRYVWTASWFDPPSTLTVTAHADPIGQRDDSWTPNNEASVEVRLNDIYPLEDGWPIGTDMIVSTTPLLIDIDSDPELEVVAVVGNRLSAWDHQGNSLWSNGTDLVNSSKAPLAADFDGDGEMEIAAFNRNCSLIYLFDGNGDCLGSTGPVQLKEYAAADMHPGGGIELVAASSGTIHLFEWDTDNFNLLASKTFRYDEVPSPFALTCKDLNGDSYAETVFCSGWNDLDIPPEPSFYSLAVYDWTDQQVLSNQTWYLDPGHEYLVVAPCAGELGGTPLIGFPQGSYDVSNPAAYPAWLVAPDGSGLDLCERSTVSAYSLRYGMFADWYPLVPGADAFVLPSESQCLAWDMNGDALDDWPTDAYSGHILRKPVCSPALGDLNGDGYADVLSGTVLDGDWQALAHDYVMVLCCQSFRSSFPGAYPILAASLWPISISMAMLRSYSAAVTAFSSAGNWAAVPRVILHGRSTSAIQEGRVSWIDGSAAFVRIADRRDPGARMELANRGHRRAELNEAVSAHAQR